MTALITPQHRYWTVWGNKKEWEERESDTWLMSCQSLQRRAWIYDSFQPRGTRPPMPRAHWSICYLLSKWMGRSCCGSQWGHRMKNPDASCQRAAVLLCKDQIVFAFLLSLSEKFHSQTPQSLHALIHVAKWISDIVYSPPKKRQKNDITVGDDKSVKCGPKYGKFGKMILAIFRKFQTHTTKLGLWT